MPTSAEFSGESGVIGSVVMSQLGRLGFLCVWFVFILERPSLYLLEKASSA